MPRKLVNSVMTIPATYKSGDRKAELISLERLTPTKSLAQLQLGVKFPSLTSGAGIPPNQDQIPSAPNAEQRLFTSI
jgi:hypothetical protein